MPLDVFDIQPRPMMKYKANNGWHFNECAAKYAVSLMMKKNPVNGKTEPIEPMTAKQVDELLAKHECLREAVRHLLHGERQIDAKLRAVAEQPMELWRIFRGCNNEDVLNAS